MNILLDTNIILRYAKVDHPQNALTRAAVQSLFEAGESLVVASQNLIEIWNVATRPSEQNGLGLPHTEAVEQLQLIEKLFTLLPLDLKRIPFGVTLSQRNLSWVFKFTTHIWSH